MSAGDNAFKRVDWPAADSWVPGDDDEYGMPARPQGSGLSADDLALLTLAARALGAVGVEVVEGEQWVNLHFADGRIVYGWNSLLFYGDAFELAVALELDIMHRVVGGKRVEILPAGGPLTQEFYEGDGRIPTARAVTRAAAEIAVAKEKEQA